MEGLPKTRNCYARARIKQARTRQQASEFTHRIFQLTADMKFPALTIYCLFLASCLVGECLAKEWRSISPLHSTRADVEKALNVKSEGKSFDVFSLGEEFVMVIYSEAPCSNGNLGKWNVPNGTVLEIVVAPKITKYLSDLKVDLSRFKKSSKVSRDYVVTTYTDEDDGFAIEVVYEGIGALYYRPSEKDRHLLCPSSSR